MRLLLIPREQALFRHSRVSPCFPVNIKGVSFNVFPITSTDNEVAESLLDLPKLTIRQLLVFLFKEE